MMIFKLHLWNLDKEIKKEKQKNTQNQMVNFYLLTYQILAKTKN